MPKSDMSQTFLSVPTRTSSVASVHHINPVALTDGCSAIGDRCYTQTSLGITPKFLSAISAQSPQLKGNESTYISSAFPNIAPVL